MLLSVVIQLAFAQRYIGDVGRVPAAQRSLKMAGGVKQPLTQVERDRLRVIFVIFTFVVIFWATFEQAGGLMNLFADKYTNREMGSFLVPTGWFQSLNPLFIVLLGVPISMLWTRLGAKGKNPATPVKMYLGLAPGRSRLRLPRDRGVRDAGFRRHEVQHDLAGARLLLPHHGRTVHQPGRPLDDHQARAAAARFADDGRLVPRESVRQHLAGYIGAFTENMGQYPWMVGLAGDFDVRPEHAGLLGVFGGLAVTLLLFSAALWAISGRVVSWMHGAEKSTK